MEEGDEGGHAEPEEEGQPRVLLGHVLVVGQDGLEVQRVPQVLEVREVGGDVEQRRDGLRHHDREGVALGRRGQLHRLVQAARFAGVDLDELASGLYRHVQVRLALSVRKHSQVDVVVLIADAVEGVAVVQHIRVGLELEVVLGELQAAEAEHHALKDAGGARPHQPLAAALLQGQPPQVPELQDLLDGGQAAWPEVLSVHGGVATEAVIFIVERRLHLVPLPMAQVGAEQRGWGAGQHVVQRQVHGQARWSVGISDLLHFHTWTEELSPEALVILEQLSCWHLQELQHFLPGQVLEHLELLGCFAFEHLGVKRAGNVHHPQHSLIQLRPGSHLETVH